MFNDTVKSGFEGKNHIPDPRLLVWKILEQGGTEILKAFIYGAGGILIGQRVWPPLLKVKLQLKANLVSF